MMNKNSPVKLFRTEEVFSKKSCKARGRKVFPGQTAWTLKDTHALPVSITKMMCEEIGLKLDEPAYE